MASPVAFSQQPATEKVEKIEVTGSKISRAETEGALPVTIITREDLEASGQATLAEYFRNSPLTTAGNFRPQSGSSAQGFSEINLRGLGSTRTLVLVDGRRVAKSPMVGDSVDINSIPMAAVERIEILTDGASAIYGSDAIGGVVNIILRKSFQGVAMSYTPTRASLPKEGGDREEASAILGLSGDKGRVIMGTSYSFRDIIYARNAFGTEGVLGVSRFANNYFSIVSRLPNGSPNVGGYLGLVPGGCTNQLFYIAPNGRCSYDFTSIAADEAQLTNKSIFARGDYYINSDWTAFMNVSVTRSESFGRYAPVPGYVVIEPGSVGHPWHPAYPNPAALRARVAPNQTIALAHRFAAGGPRDTTQETGLYDTLFGVKGRFQGVDVEAGVRKSTSRFLETGLNFVVEPLARAAIFSGAYNIFNPASTPASVLRGFTTNTSRDGRFDQTEQYVSATFDLFQAPGGMARAYAGFDQRKEVYQDIYDSLSEAGVVLGSAGASAAGTRKVRAFGAEVVIPVTKQVEASIAGRRENYSDYGGDFSPKASIRWAPTKTVTLRASAGEGFSAPTLPQIYSNPAFSADSIVDFDHCVAEGYPAVGYCDFGIPVQINGLRVSKRDLQSEKSKQWSFGGSWDVTKNFSVKADIWNVKIDNVLRFISAQNIVNRDTGLLPFPIPPHLGITREPDGLITQVISGFANEGTLEQRGIDLNAAASFKVGSFGQIRSEASFSRTLRARSYGLFDFDGSFEFPRDRGTLTNRWTRGSWDAAWNVNYIGKHGDPEDYYAGAYTTHDLQLGWQTPIKGVRIVLGAVNAFEKRPPLVSVDTRPFSYVLYDGYGRQAYARVELKL